MLTTSLLINLHFVFVLVADVKTTAICIIAY